ncbi:HAMP domain-containing sensor histidine kinase [Cytobacillus citreus]|uniref:sensor histidine kinase n=1 Tax=Cytobacillus citreus TaxID=2833586 RepID=UPI003083F268
MYRRFLLHYISSFIFISFCSILAMLFLSPIISAYTLHLLNLDASDNQPLYIVLFAGPPIIIFFITNFVYASKMGKSLNYYFDWIDQLTKGNYKVNAKMNKKSNRLFSFKGLFQELNEQMTELTSTLQRNEQERIEHEELRRQWTSGVTHDLKTPLSYIQGYAAMLLSEKYNWSKEEREDYLNIIHEKALHMRDLINDLNITYKMEENQISIDKKRHNLTVLLEELIDDIVKEPGLSRGQVFMAKESLDVSFPFDQQLLKRALYNIVSNGVIYNPIGTNIVIKVNEDKNQVFIEIQDNGVGLSEKDMKRVFTRYYRGTSTDVVEGTGLGLSIAEQFIKLHSGSISVTSELKKGTRFLITLPRT